MTLRRDGADLTVSPVFFPPMENDEEFWMLLLIALAQRVYELEQRLETLEGLEDDRQRTARTSS